MGDGCWVLGGEGWVMMNSDKEVKGGECWVLGGECWVVMNCCDGR